MTSGWFDSTITWISAHPVAAGGLIFLIAFCDSIIVLGIVVPALPLLFAIGALIGLGHIDGPYALACASLGAFLGDAIGYWVGRRWGPQLREHWPFSRYPQLLERGEQVFRRHGAKSILIARFVGAIRAFVPAIAGMLRMPLQRYVPMSLLACVLWAGVFLAPGWVLGASYDAVAAVADRLVLVLGGLLVVLALAWAAVVYGYRWFDRHANNLLARALRWTRVHPRLARYTAALIDPNRPESPSLAILAACLLAIGWAWFALLGAVLMRGEPLALDLSVYRTMYALRNPLADRMMAGLASIGDWEVLLPASALALLWLLWRRRWIAAAHWIAALAFGLVLTTGLSWLIDMPLPPTARSGFGFPSVGVTMTTITFGFFAVLIARELPGRTRVWPYLVSALVVAVLGFARLYLGAHWLSDVVGGTLLGIVWLLVLGIAYRRHVARSFWMRPLAWIFYTSFAVAALWHAPRAVDPLLQRFAAPASNVVLDRDAWWQRDWAQLPAYRNERDLTRRWALEVQVAGSLAPLQGHLRALGWQAQRQANWTATLGLLDDDTPAAQQPVLPATLDTEAEALLLRRPTADGRLQVLRLWHAPARLADGTPLWVGTTQTLEFAHPLSGLFGIWLPVADGDRHADEALQALRHALTGFPMRESPHPHTGTPVLRVRTDAAARSGQQAE